MPLSCECRRSGQPGPDELFADLGFGQDPELFDTLESKERRREIYERYQDILASGELVQFIHLSDLHIPYQDLRVVKEAVEYAQLQGVNRCIINGDFLDIYAASEFAKDKHVELKRELYVAGKVLETLSSVFDEVILIEGNHERRIKKYTAKRIDTVLQFLFDVDLLEVLAESWSNVTYARGWWVKIGSVIFAHPDNFSSVPGRTAVNTSMYFKKRGEAHSAVVIGHTHKIISGVVGGVAIYEAGCQAYDMDYLDDGKMSFDAWARGFGHIVLTSSGDIDFAASRVVPSLISSPILA